MLITVILVVLIIIIIQSDYLNKKRINKIFQASGIGGFNFTLPLIGDLASAIGLTDENLEKYIRYWGRKYGKVYRLWYMEKCILFVEDAEYVKHILNSSHLLKKGFFYDLMSVWLGKGMLLADGSRWQTIHKSYIQAFHMKKMDQYIEKFDQLSHIMVERLKPLANGSQVIDVFPIACATTLDMLLASLFDCKLTAQSPEALGYMKGLKCIFSILFDRFLKPFQQLDFVYKLLSFKSYHSLQKHVKMLHEFSEKILNTKIEERANSYNEFDLKENAPNDIGLKKPIPNADLLLKLEINGKPLTYTEMREEIDNILLGGHDTLTIAISFILYLLSRHPQEQQKLFEEIVNIVGPDPNEPVTMRNLQEMKYLELVIKESLRLYPPVPFIARVTEEDYKFDDKIIPRNTHIVIMIKALCRDPDYFPRPNEFIPERFENAEINPYAYIPFSAGRRNCMGQKFAFLQMKCVVSCILRHYELVPLGPDVVPIITFMMSSKTGMNVGLQPRVY